jgi:starvation-inducible DNA-binding protein
MKADARKATANALSQVLADTYTLYLKTHNYHWNVTGPSFNALHTMFETQYSDMALAVDAVAERIRALGEHAPGSYREFAALASIPEAEGRPDARSMLEDLVRDNETLVAVMSDARETAEQAGDVPTSDMLIARMQTHQKFAWMLRASL